MARGQRARLESTWLDAAPIGTGSAEARRADAPATYDGVLSVLWLPDPEQRHGWREHYIRAPEAPKRRTGLVS